LWSSPSSSQALFPVQEEHARSPKKHSSSPPSATLEATRPGPLRSPRSSVEGRSISTPTRDGSLSPHAIRPHATIPAEVKRVFYAVVLDEYIEMWAGTSDAPVRCIVEPSVAVDCTSSAAALTVARPFWPERSPASRRAAWPPEWSPKSDRRAARIAAHLPFKHRTAARVELMQMDLSDRSQPAISNVAGKSPSKDSLLSSPTWLSRAVLLSVSLLSRPIRKNSGNLKCGDSVCAAARGPAIQPRFQSY